MQIIAKDRGGKCLSQTYINANDKLLWQCRKGHRWESTPGSIKSDTRCPFCAKKVKGTLEEMIKIASERGGRCLSEKYIDRKTKLLWECSEGHQWEGSPDSIIRGSWCPVCAPDKIADKLRLNIDKMKELAKSKGGKCLSKIYTDVHTKLLWECSEGHQWEAKPRYIKRGN